MSTLVFNGSDEQQQLADEIFQIMRYQGTFCSPGAPIRQALRNLAQFLSEKYTSDPATMEMQIDAALRKNEQVFTREEVDDEVFYVTSRLGRYAPNQEDVSHSFKNRLYEPENPLPVDDISVVVSTSRPALTSVEPVFISDYWQEQAEFATFPMEDDEDDLGYERGDDGKDEAVGGVGVDRRTISPYADDSVLKPESETHYMQQSESELGDEQQGAGTEDRMATLAHQQSSVAEELLAAIETSLWQGSVGEPTQSTEMDAAQTGGTEPTDATDTGQDGEPVETQEGSADSAIGVAATDEGLGVSTEPTAAIMTEAEQESATLEEGTPTTAHAEDAIHVQAEEELAPEEEEDVVEPEPPFQEHTTFFLPDGTPIDLSGPTENVLKLHKDTLENMLLDRLEEDPLRRIVRFGRSLYSESGVVNLGKNDLRRIRDYINEVGEPLSDTAVIADLYYHNPRNADYEGFRFSLNYRLSREKDFEFVGVEGSYLWSTKNLSVVGARRIKISEMGQLTTYLTEQYDDSLELQSAQSIRETKTVNRLLTFFEWEYGILPLDRSLALLLPDAVLAEQRAAILRIESPQHYTHFLVEMRFPTGNRGGWIQGLYDFFHEHLVAGALITLSATEEPNVFTITYDEAPAVSGRLLTLDEKKNKFAFADIQYDCVVDDDQVLMQQRFGKAKNLKSLPMSERRKGEVMLEHVFKVMGERIGSREEPVYGMELDDLYVAYNILRPASRSYLRKLLEDHEHCSVDDSSPNTYYYSPEPEPVVVDVDTEDDDDDPMIRKWGRYIDEEV